MRHVGLSDDPKDIATQDQLPVSGGGIAKENFVAYQNARHSGLLSSAAGRDITDDYPGVGYFRRLSTNAYEFITAITAATSFNDCFLEFLGAGSSAARVAPFSGITFSTGTTATGYAGITLYSTAPITSAGAIARYDSLYSMFCQLEVQIVGLSAAVQEYTLASNLNFGTTTMCTIRYARTASTDWQVIYRNAANSFVTAGLGIAVAAGLRAFRSEIVWNPSTSLYELKIYSGANMASLSLVATFTDIRYNALTPSSALFPLASYPNVTARVTKSVGTTATTVRLTNLDIGHVFK